MTVGGDAHQVGRVDVLTDRLEFKAPQGTSESEVDYRDSQQCQDQRKRNEGKVTQPGKSQEIQLTDALQLLLEEQVLYAFEIDGVRYDTGTPLGWLEATVSLALNRDDIGPKLRSICRNYSKDNVVSVR